MGTEVEAPDRPPGASGNGPGDGGVWMRLVARYESRGVPLRTIVAAVVVVDLVVLATLAALAVLSRLRQIILWVFIAAFVALILNPAVGFFERRHFRRTTAVAMVFAIAVVAFVGLLVLFGYPLINAVTHFAEGLNPMIAQLKKGHGHLADVLNRVHLLSWVQQNAPKLQKAAGNLGKPALSLGSNLGKAVVSTVLALTTIAFLSLFILLEAPVLRRAIMALLPGPSRERVEDVSRRVSQSVTAYVLGTAALSLLFGVVVVIALVILGVPFALLLGLWVALFAMIPLVGGIVAGVPVILVALFQDPVAGAVMLVIFVSFQLVENHLLYPIVMARTVRMNPLWVLLAVLIGANLGGIFGSALGALTGALVAIPVGGAIQVIVREFGHRRQADETRPTDVADAS